jgi:putative transposase
VEAASVQPEQANMPSQAASIRLLTRLEPDGKALWQEAQGQVQWQASGLVIHDSTLDKPYARRMELAKWHRKSTGAFCGCSTQL